MYLPQISSDDSRSVDSISTQISEIFMGFSRFQSHIRRGEIFFLPSQDDIQSVDSISTQIVHIVESRSSQKRSDDFSPSLDLKRKGGELS